MSKITNNGTIVGAKELTIEVGHGGESLVLGYTGEERRVDDLTIKDYRRMIDNDGQMQMLWNAISNTILSAGIEFQDDENAGLS